jgi:hypothetical protein
MASPIVKDYTLIAQAYAAKDMYKEAIRYWQQAGRPAAKEWLPAYQRGGKRALWRAMLDQAFDSSGRLQVTAESVAQLYSLLGMNDRAFEWLEECRTKGYPLRYLKVSPNFDTLACYLLMRYSPA